MNKKLIALIVIAVIIVSTIIVTIFGAKAAAGEFNVKVKQIKVYGYFDSDHKQEFLPENGVIIIEIKKNAQYFQFACEIIPDNATYPTLIYTSNSQFFDVDEEGLVTIKGTNKSGDITISNRDSGIRVTVKFVLEGKGGGNIGELPW